MEKNYKAFSIPLRVHLVRYTTICPSTAPKPNVKFITYMNIENVFYLPVVVLFSLIHKLDLIGPKSKYLVVSFLLE